MDQGFVVRTSRPKRYAWFRIKLNQKKIVRVSRRKIANSKDELKNYYAFLEAVGENNESLPYNSKMNRMNEE